MDGVGLFSWIDDDRCVTYWAILLGIPLLLASMAIFFVPFNPSMPDFYWYAQEYVRTGKIVETNYPLEYAWAAGLCLKLGGIRAFELAQALVYLLTVLSVWLLAKTIGTRNRYALLAGLLTSSYPQLPVSITKLWDVDCAVFLLVFLILAVVALERQGLNVPIIVGTGIVFGCGMAQRPNMILMMPLIVYALWTAPSALQR